MSNLNSPIPPSPSSDGSGTPTSNRVSTLAGSRRRGEAKMADFVKNLRMSMALEGKIQIFVATFPYKPQSQNELELRVGDQVMIPEEVTDSPEWLYGERGDESFGWFPRHCGQIYRLDSTSMTSATSAIRLSCRDSYDMNGLVSPLTTMGPTTRENSLKICLAKMWDTEKEYVQHLGILVAGFAQPLELRDTKYKQQLLANPQLTVLCGSMRDLFIYHSRFLQVISSGTKTITSKFLLDVGAAFGDLGARFDAYKDYLTNQAEVVGFLAKQAKQLAAFLEANPLPGPYNLETLLVLPVEQYREYRPMLEMLIRLSPKRDTEVVEFLTDTFVDVSKATAKVDKAYDSYQDERELLQIQSEFVGKVSIFQRGRRLVFSDRLFKVLARDSSKEPRIVHLFNDIVIYSIPRGKRLQFRKCINLLGCQVNNVENSETQINCFDVVSASGEATRFCAHSEEVKAIWMELIQQQVTRAAEMHEVTNQQAMVQNAVNGLQYIDRVPQPLSRTASTMDILDLVDRMAQLTAPSRAPPRKVVVVDLARETAVMSKRLNVVVTELALPLIDASRGAALDGTGGQVQGTTTAMGAMAASLMMLTSSSASTDKVLQDPDVVVFLQTLQDLQNLFTSLLTELDLRMQAAKPGDDVSVAMTIANILNERLFESYAWSFDAAYRNFSAQPLSDFKAVSDGKLSIDSTTTERVLFSILESMALFSTKVEELLKATPASHPERKDCETLAKTIDAIDAKMKKALDERRNYDKLVAIKSVIYSGKNKAMESLVSRQRQFVREGPLVKVCRNSNKTFMFWLTNDYLIYASSLPNGKYSLNHCIELKRCRVFSREYSGSHGFEVLANEKTFIALATSEAQRDEWLRDISDAVDRLQSSAGGGGAAGGFRSSAARRGADELAGIEVTGYEDREVKNSEGKVMSKYTVYFFQVTNFGGTEWTVIHRYREVLDFHKQLKQTGNDSIDNFPFPPQTLFNSGKSLKEKRRNAFALYFKLLLELEQRPTIELATFFQPGSRTSMRLNQSSSPSTVGGAAAPPPSGQASPFFSTASKAAPALPYRPGATSPASPGGSPLMAASSRPQPPPMPARGSPLVMGAAAAAGKSPGPQGQAPNPFKNLEKKKSTPPAPPPRPAAAGGAPTGRTTTKTPPGPPPRTSTRPGSGQGASSSRVQSNPFKAADSQRRSGGSSTSPSQRSPGTRTGASSSGSSSSVRKPTSNPSNAAGQSSGSKNASSNGGGSTNPFKKVAASASPVSPPPPVAAAAQAPSAPPRSKAGVPKAPDRPALKSAPAVPKPTRAAPTLKPNRAAPAPPSKAAPAPPSATAAQEEQRRREQQQQQQEEEEKARAQMLAERARAAAEEDARRLEQARQALEEEKQQQREQERLRLEQMQQEAKRKADEEAEEARNRVLRQAEEDARQIVEEARRKAEEEARRYLDRANQRDEEARRGGGRRRSPSPPPVAQAMEEVHKAKVLYPFDAQEEWQATVYAGEQVDVVEQNPNGWWQVEPGMDRDAGYVPASYLELLPSTPAAPSPPPPPPRSSAVASQPSRGLPQGVDKYAKMLKLGLPRAAVEMKMSAEGVDPTLLPADPASDTDSVSSAASNAAPLGARGGGRPAGGPASFLDQLKQPVKLQAVQPVERSRPTASPMNGLMAELQQGRNLRKVDKDQVAAERARQQAAGPTGGLMGALAAAVNARRGAINDSSDSSDSDDSDGEGGGEWSASDEDSD